MSAGQFSSWQMLAGRSEAQNEKIWQLLEKVQTEILWIR